MGGEKMNKRYEEGRKPGSPPRGRGKELVPTRGFGFKRITPAWAGKRFWNRPWVWATSDHPRVGGEKKPDLYYAGLAQGSPPRGQGKADPSLPRIDRIGITPAWAGKSGKLYRRHMGAQDHPRVGGEKSMA